MINTENFELFPDEEIQEVTFVGKVQYKYAITNFGRSQLQRIKNGTSWKHIIVT